MMKFRHAILPFLLWSAFALIVHEYISNSIFGNCAIAHNNSDTLEKKNHIENTSIINEAAISKSITITADGTTIFNSPKGFAINSLNGNVEISNELTSFKDFIYNYLNKNQGKELVISANHLVSEVDTVNGTHFGNSRIQFLKDILVKAGINSDRIIPKTVQSQYQYDEQGNFYDGISMTFQDISNDRLTVIEEGISNKILYSNFAASEFKPDRELKTYTIEMKNYLVKYPHKKVYIVGHTDSVGVDNYRWGLDRAFNVKEYLTSQDVAPSIIICSSKGEDAPIADNGTEEGRAKNRRIEITIK